MHDHDAAKILHALLKLHATIGLLRYPAACRTLAAVFWALFEEGQEKKRIAGLLAGAGHIQSLFADPNVRKSYQARLAEHIGNFAETSGLFDSAQAGLAAEYLFEELAETGPFAASRRASDLRRDFEQYLRDQDSFERFADTIQSLASDPPAVFGLLRDWVASWLARTDRNEMAEYIDEAAVLLHPLVAAAYGDRSRGHVYHRGYGRVASEDTAGPLQAALR